MLEILKPNYKFIFLIILVFSFATKAWRLDLPKTYYFDEIYYGFTAEQYAQGNMDAWIYNSKAPEGFAYTWDHPPTGKLLMSLPIQVLGKSNLSRRLVPFLFGVALTVTVYCFSLTVFPGKKLLALLSATLISLDGLTLSMSRIALVDTILAVFILCSTLYMWKRNLTVSAIFFGLAVSTKWTGVYVLPVLCLVLLFDFLDQKKQIWLSLYKALRNLLKYLLIGTVIYVVSYTPFIVNFGWGRLVDLQKQMYLYHTELTAIHPYQSKAYTWPFDIRPVWFWVDWGTHTVSNIYAMGNPVIFWAGTFCVLAVLVIALKTKSRNLLFLLACYFIFWLPWVFSPRLMFLYHYLPSVPFLVLCTGLFLERLLAVNKRLGWVVTTVYLGLVFVVFCYFYPYWTGLEVSRETAQKYVWLDSWK